MKFSNKAFYFFLRTTRLKTWSNNVGKILLGKVSVQISFFFHQNIHQVPIYQRFNVVMIIIFYEFLDCKKVSF